MKKRLYVAYGSNLNFRQMKFRCPTAKLYGTGLIKHCVLQFKGNPTSAFATIAPQEDASVPVAVWEIQPQDEQSLDRYEGYPNHYFKQDVTVHLDNGATVCAMAYVMNLDMNFGLPSPQYYWTVREGYDDCKLDVAALDQAARKSAQQFLSSANYSEQSAEEDPLSFSDDIKL